MFVILDRCNNAVFVNKCFWRWKDWGSVYDCQVNLDQIYLAHYQQHCIEDGIAPSNQYIIKEEPILVPTPITKAPVATKSSRAVPITPPITESSSSSSSGKKRHNHILFASVQSDSKKFKIQKNVKDDDDKGNIPIDLLRAAPSSFPRFLSLNNQKNQNNQDNNNDESDDGGDIISYNGDEFEHILAHQQKIQ